MGVETISLREGLSLVLSQIGPGEECQYHHVEPEDVFALGFHLKGGSRFEMGREHFSTQPLDVWAGAAPRSASSTFTLPSVGFRTVALRFSPDAASDLLARIEPDGGALSTLAGRCDQEIGVLRLSSLVATAAALVETMFTTPYTGSARLLHLESCAFGLLAAQVHAGQVASRPQPAMAALRRRVEAARDWLDSHLEDPPTILELARLVGTNEFSLKRGFKEAFGTTVFGYVRQRRMERAAANLNAGRSVTEAAFAAGYDCPRCFADAFRRHFGVLPRDLRRAFGPNPPSPHA